MVQELGSYENGMAMFQRQGLNYGPGATLNYYPTNPLGAYPGATHHQDYNQFQLNTDTGLPHTGSPSPPSWTGGMYNPATSGARTIDDWSSAAAAAAGYASHTGSMTSSLAGAPGAASSLSYKPPQAPASIPHTAMGAGTFGAPHATHHTDYSAYMPTPQHANPMTMGVGGPHQSPSPTGTGGTDNTGNAMVNSAVNRQSREPYGWMKRQSYQTSSASGKEELPKSKTRTKDKYRIVYSEYQKVELEKEYLYSKYITIQRKAELSRSIGLSERQVKIWFQNRRAKERKMKRKREDAIANIQNGSDMKDGCSSSESEQIKMEPHQEYVPMPAQPQQISHQMQ